MKSKLKIIERQNDTLHKLNEIAAISDISPKETLRKALQIGTEYFGIEFGIVSHIVGEDYTVDVQFSPPGTLFDGQLFALGSTYCKTTLEIDDVLAIQDVTTSKYTGHPCHRDYALVSYIGAAIVVNSKVYGTINFSSASARKLEYDKIDDEFMKLLARWAGSFLERQLALDELSLTKKQFEMIFENNASGIILIDEECQILMVNKRFSKIIGFSKEELLEQNTLMFYLDQMAHEMTKQQVGDSNKDSYLTMEHQLVRKDGENIWCEFVGSQIEFIENKKTVVWSILDITIQKELQAKLEQQATVDFLTDLYNKRYFISRLDEELSKITRHKNTTVSLMMFDLDNFKQVNDTYGHLMGDTVLRAFADILRQYLRKEDIAGRIGGEEFALILPDVGVEKALILAEKIRKAVINKTVYLHNMQVNFTVSVGLTDLKYDDVSYTKSLDRADIALYKSKANGRNRVSIKS